MKASLLKQRFMNEPDQCFEALTFGELSVGQKFICLPLPGDNHGHGGFKKTHYIFTKANQQAIVWSYGMIGYLPRHGEAIDASGKTNNFPNDLLVILVA